MKFCDLNSKRKLAIQILSDAYPGLQELSLAQIKSWWATYSQLGARKVGYPLWLVGEKEFRSATRGFYVLPLPQPGDTLADAPATKPALTPPTLGQLAKPREVDTPAELLDPSILTEEEFLDECRQAGIQI